jgi:hypothetical protein
MFYGGALEGERRHVTDWSQVVDFFSSLKSSGMTVPPDARFVDVALYWHGPTWEPFIADPAKLKTLPLPRVPAAPLAPPGTTNIVGLIQPARLYLAAGNRPALFDYYSATQYPGLQPLGDKALDILRRFNVPTK